MFVVEDETSVSIRLTWQSPARIKMSGMASAVNGMPIKSITNDCVKEKGQIQEEDEEEEEIRTSKRKEEKVRRNAGIRKM